MSKRKNMLLREQAPTQHILSFCRMAKLLLTLYSILVKNKEFFGVRNIKKGDYFAKKIHKLFGKFWFTNKKKCDILQNGNFILLSFW